MPTGAPIDFVSHGSVSLPIYYSPLRKRIESKPSAGGAVDLALGSGSTMVMKVYDSYVAVWHEGTPSRRRRCRGATITLCKNKARKVAQRLAKEGGQVVELTPEERRMYTSAKQILVPLQLDVDAAARLLADLHKQLNGASPYQAIDFFNTFGRKLALGTTTPQGVEIYLSDLKPRVGDYHYRDVRKFLLKFANALPGELAPITTPQIDTWLGGLGGGACNKNNARDRVITFYNFMQKKGYAPSGF